VGSIVRHLLGWLLLVVGVAGLVLPILQGWLLIAMGALLLAPDVPFFARLAERIERRFPPLAVPLRRWRKRLGHGDAPPDD
jgi:uncharacterized protein YqgC (DUF456 family)